MRRALSRIEKFTDDDLNDKEKLFVEYYAVHNMTISQAALKAGYLHVKSGYQLMRSPTVRAAVIKQRQANAEKLEITRDTVLQGLTDAINQAKLMADPSAQVAGWREVAKICGFYEPEASKPMSDIQKRLVERFENMDDEQLMALMAQETKGIILEHNNE